MFYHFLLFKCWAVPMLTGSVVFASIKNEPFLNHSKHQSLETLKWFKDHLKETQGSLLLDARRKEKKSTNYLIERRDFQVEPREPKDRFKTLLLFLTGFSSVFSTNHSSRKLPRSYSWCIKREVWLLHPCRVLVKWNDLDKNRDDVFASLWTLCGVVCPGRRPVYLIYCVELHWRVTFWHWWSHLGAWGQMCDRRTCKRILHCWTGMLWGIVLQDYWQLIQVMYTLILCQEVHNNLLMISTKTLIYVIT